MISMIVAHDDNRVIGKGLTIPWHIKADLNNFKKTTSGHTVVMGRKTFESIGKPLPNRLNIVLTNDLKWVAPKGILVKNFASDVMARDEDMFIIGGSQIYEKFLPHAKKLYITRVYGKFDGDIYFPSYDKDFIERSRSQIFGEDHVNFRFLEFENGSL